MIHIVDIEVVIMDPVLLDEFFGPQNVMWLNELVARRSSPEYYSGFYAAIGMNDHEFSAVNAVCLCNHLSE